MAPTVEEELATANQILANEGVFEALGHISVRNPDGDGMLISRSLAPKQVRASDILEVGLHEDNDETYNERIIHQAIYREREDVGAIVHHHAPAVMPFAIADVPISPTFPAGTLFRDGVPRFADYDDDYGYLVVTEDEGVRMARDLGDHHAQLLAMHGANVVGSSLKEAIVLTMWLVQNANYQLQAMQLGDPPYQPQSAALAEGTEDVLLSEGVTNRLWNYYVHELP
jgi:HCOMODA/2-hydroxy-3-carboxy-muconic semialdehyde decarboxylase